MATSKGETVLVWYYINVNTSFSLHLDITEKVPSSTITPYFLNSYFGCVFQMLLLYIWNVQILYIYLFSNWDMSVTIMCFKFVLQQKYSTKEKFCAWGENLHKKISKHVQKPKQLKLFPTRCTVQYASQSERLVQNKTERLHHCFFCRKILLLLCNHNSSMP